MVSSATSRAIESTKLLTGLIAVAALISCLPARADAQAASLASAAVNVSPETGFVADDRYTNAFFGLVLPLPKEIRFDQSAQVLEEAKALAKVPLRHVLYIGQGSGGTIMTVIADECRGASFADARKALPQASRPEIVEIGGKQFWKTAYLEEKLEGPLPFLPPVRSPLRSYRYATALNDYILQISVFSDRLDDFHLSVRSIENLIFIEPPKAKEMAGPYGRPYGTPRPGWDSAEVSGNTYSHAMLHFSYEFPAGWNVADQAVAEKALHAAREAAQGWDDLSRRMDADLHCVRVLLSLTKYREDALRGEFNPRIFVIAVDPICFRVFDFPAPQDRAAIDKTVEAVEGTLKGAPFMGKDGRKVNAYSLEGHSMLEVSGAGAVDVPGHKALLQMHTSLILSPLQYFWLGWGFLSDSPSDLPALKNLKIRFPPPEPAPLADSKSR